MVICLARRLRRVLSFWISPRKPSDALYRFDKNLGRAARAAFSGRREGEDTPVTILTDADNDVMTLQAASTAAGNSSD